MLFVLYIHKTWFVFSLHCILHSYRQIGGHLCQKCTQFYKHLDLLYTIACIYIYIPLHVYVLVITPLPML